MIDATTRLLDPSLAMLWTRLIRAIQQMDSFFSQSTLFVLALVGFVRIVVPALFAGARICVQEYYGFRIWLRDIQH